MQWASTDRLWCSAACAKAKRPLNPAGAREPAPTWKRRCTSCCGELAAQGIPGAGGAVYCSTACAPVAVKKASEPARPLSERLGAYGGPRKWLKTEVLALEADLLTAKRERAEEHDIQVRELAELETSLENERREVERLRVKVEAGDMARASLDAEVESLRAKLVEGEDERDDLKVKLDGAEKEAVSHFTAWRSAHFRADKATARVRAIKKACANAARKYAQDNSNGLAISTGEGIAEAIERLPDDAGTDTVASREHFNHSHPSPSGDAECSTRGRETATVAEAVIGLVVTCDWCGTDTIPSECAHLHICQGTILYGHQKLLRGPHRATAIAAAVTAAYNRAADAFEEWRDDWYASNSPTRMNSAEFVSHLRAGCPAPGEAGR